MPEPSNYTAPRWAWWIATGFGSGRIKPAPGTWGSLAACGVWLGGIYLLQFLPDQLFGPLAGILTLKMIFASIIASGLVARQTGEGDPRYIVSDEWAGMWLALWPARGYVADALGSGGWTASFASVLAAFLLFRLFDIWKPWPIRKLEALPGGWGITMDDVAAGILAGLLLYCAHIIFI